MRPHDQEKPTLTKGTEFIPLARIFLTHCETFLRYRNIFLTPDELVWLKIFMGLRYQNVGLFKKSEEILLEALKGNIKDPTLLIELHRILGTLYVFLGNGVEAKKYLLKGLSIAHNIKNDYERGNLLLFIGSAYRAEGEYEQAVIYGEDALKFLEEKDRTRAWAKGYLGFFYNDMERYGEAEKILKESKDLYLT